MDPDAIRTLAASLPDGRKTYGVVGDTYTTILSGRDTAGRFALIDMRVPPGGGPPPHAHDFEETFLVLEGELEVLCGDRRLTAGPDAAVNVPANVPHKFQNKGASPVRMLCVVAPAGLEEFFAEVGEPLPGPTSAAHRPTPAELEARKGEMEAAAARHRISFVPPDHFDKHPPRDAGP